MLNHFNLVNIRSVKGPKRKPHIQLGDGFCIQFVMEQNEGPMDTLAFSNGTA